MRALTRRDQFVDMNDLARRILQSHDMLRIANRPNRPKVEIRRFDCDWAKRLTIFGFQELPKPCCCRCPASHGTGMLGRLG